MTSTQFEVRGQDYSRIILPLARQERSLLYDRVYVKSDITGKCFYQDQIGKWEMSAKTTVNPDTPETGDVTTTSPETEATPETSAQG